MYAALGLQEEHFFQDLLRRNERQAEKKLQAYLDQPSEHLHSSALLFHVREIEVEREIEEMEG